MLKSLKGNIHLSLLLRIALILILYTVCRFIFLIFNLDSFNNLDSSEIFLIFLGGFKFDLSALLYLNSAYIFSQILPFTFVYRPKYRRVTNLLFIITNSIGLAANLADVAYYPFTLKRTTFTVFAQFAHEENMIKLFLKFMFVDFWYLTLIFIGMVWLFSFLNKKIKVQEPSFVNNKWLFYPSGISIMLLLTWFSIIGMRGGFGRSTRPITISNAGEFVDHPADINLVVDTPFSIMKTMNTKPLKPLNYFSPSQLDSIYNPVHQPVAGNFQKKNVVFIILESFSREYLGGFNKGLDNGKYKGYSPFLDSLKKVSLSFNNAYANGRKSIEGLPSIISSIPGINEPFVLGYYSGNKFSSIGGLLSKEGYYSAFFHGAPNGSMGFTSYVQMAGIQHYYGKTEYNNDNDFDGVWGIWDEPFLQFMAHKLNTFKQPFFSTVFTVSSHHPFQLPDKYKGKFPLGTLPVHKDVGYTDLSLKEFFQTVSKYDWYKNTIFVLTADHSSVAWHKEYKTTIGAFAVPIIIFDPTGQLKAEINYPVQQTDIMPTILDYLHYPKPYFAFGFDMLKHDDNSFVVNYIDGDDQMIMGDYVLISRNGQSIKLYNYKNDILLQHNLINQLPEQRTKMENHLKAFLQQYNDHMIHNSLVAK